VTVDTALPLGRAVADVCRTTLPGRPRIVIGRDTRWSGDMLESALAAGICSCGVDVLLARSHPDAGGGVFHDAQLERLRRRVVVSARTTPSRTMASSSLPLAASSCRMSWKREIERRVAAGGSGTARPTGSDVGKIVRLDDAADRYCNFVKRSVPAGLSLSGLTIAVDCAHGAAYQLGPALLRDLGARVVTIGTSPDGLNINDQCGATRPERLQALVTAEQAQLVLPGTGMPIGRFSSMRRERWSMATRCWLWSRPTCCTGGPSSTPRSLPR